MKTSSRTVFTILRPVTLLRAQRRKKPVNQKKTADDVLRRLLCDGRMRGMRFECNKRIAGIVVDYYCEAAKLAVEIERPGMHHRMRRKEEADRRAMLERCGVKIMRFPEEIILQRPESVRNTIIEELPQDDSSP